MQRVDRAVSLRRTVNSGRARHSRVTLAVVGVVSLDGVDVGRHVFKQASGVVVSVGIHNVELFVVVGRALLVRWNRFFVFVFNLGGTFFS